MTKSLLKADLNHTLKVLHGVSLPLMKKWYQLALFNLIVVALLGLLLRYKMNFSFPFLEQENILHAHSHFAFDGWIGFLLQVLIVDVFTKDYKKSPLFWNRFFLLSTIVNYAMIFCFGWEGYGGISIALSTATLWLSYLFAYKIFKALPSKQNNNISTRFVKAALFFMLLSSLGPYALAVIMATHVGGQYAFQNALYFFLHFQYNGWFTFATLAFIVKKREQSTVFHFKKARLFYRLLAGTCIPSYFFTMLWQHRPEVVTVIMILTAVAEAMALCLFLQLAYQNRRNFFTPLPASCQWLYGLAIAAYTLKVILPFFILNDHISQFALGLRPVIIGYLHLVFLAFVSMYLLGVLVEKNIIPYSKRISNAGVTILAAGIIINEILLAVQGFAAIYSLYLPAINKLLFFNTFLLVAGAIVVFVATRKNQTAPAFYTTSLQLNI